MAGAKKTAKKIFSKDTLKERVNPLSGMSKGKKKKHVLKNMLLPGNPSSIKDVATGESFANPKKVLEEGAEDLGTLFTPDIPVPEEETIIPIPDESVAALEARRRQQRRKGTGRASTILTEGLGG